MTKEGKAKRKLRHLAIFARRGVIALLILAQVLFYFALIYTGKAFITWLDYLFTVISMLIAIYVINTDKKFSYKLSWVFLLLFAPIVGGVMYIIFHTQNVTIRAARHARLEYASLSALFDAPEIKELPERKHSLVNYLANVGGFPLYANGESRYFPSGEEFFKAFTAELRKAEKYIFLEYFIISEGELWDEIFEILVQKAKDGLDIRVMYDDIGSLLSLPTKYPKVLADKGIKCYCFNKFRPVVTSIQNNRDHRKIAVIDGKTAFTGGANIADEYVNKIERFGHWKDCGIMIKGGAARSFAVIFLQLWSICNKSQESYLKFYPTGEDTPLSQGYVQPYADNPLDKEYVGEQVYMNIIKGAEKYLYFTTPYLIIDDAMLEALKTAAKSGVDVRIITPQKYDKKLIHYATISYYKELLNAGVKIYEYTGGFIHAKVCLCDDEIATVGTVNLDFRSLYLHFEDGIVLYGGDVLDSIKSDFTDTLATATKIEISDCSRNIFLRLFQSFLRLFAPLI